MRKRILTLLSFCFGISSFAFATTPYRQISGPTAYQPYGTTQHPTTYSAPYQTNNVATYTRNTGLYNPYNAHGTSRYYTPQNFDRLADSGVYLGLSAAYSNIMGDIKSDYSYFDVPGATHGADFKADSVIPFGLSVGATVNSDIRIDLSYNYYSGIHYPSNVEYDDQMYVNNVPVSGGRIKSQATMFNLYYNLESVLGNLFGGKLVPYVGVGLGISINTLSDYQIVNENDLENGDVDYDGLGTTIYYEVINPTYSYHAGGTTQNLAYSGEFGFTADLSGGLKLDIFAKYMNLGKVESSGMVFNDTDRYYYLDEASYTGGDDPVAEAGPIGEQIPDCKESGKLSSVDIGVRLRVQF